MKFLDGNICGNVVSTFNPLKNNLKKTSFKIVGSPVRYTDACNAIRSAPPLLGQHTREILSEHLHYSQTSLEELKVKKAINYPDKIVSIQNNNNNKSHVHFQSTMSPVSGAVGGGLKTQSSDASGATMLNGRHAMHTLVSFCEFIEFFNIFKRRRSQKTQFI